MVALARYFPQSDSAAADVIWPFCSSVMTPAVFKSFAAFVTHDTYLPWRRPSVALRGPQIVRHACAIDRTEPGGAA